MSDLLSLGLVDCTVTPATVRDEDSKYEASLGNSDILSQSKRLKGLGMQLSGRALG
jgi:hypothetical protein